MSPPTASSPDAARPRARVAVVGLGGLGCPAAWSLSHAGVDLRLLDEDRVERSNLHRQSLYTDGDLGRAKVIAAAEALRGTGVALDPVAEHVTPDRALTLLAGVDAIVEGSDNLPTKFLVADAARVLGLPVVHGACVGWMGTVLPVHPARGACYRCVFEDIPRGDDAVDCATAGVWGPLTAVVGALMAAEALRLLRGDAAHAGSLSRYDGWRQRFRVTDFARRSDCPLCAPGAPAPPLTDARYALETDDFT